MDNMGYRRKIWGNMGKYLRKYGIVAGTEKKRAKRQIQTFSSQQNQRHNKKSLRNLQRGSMLWPVWQLVHVNKWMFIPITSGI